MNRRTFTASLGIAAALPVRVALAQHTAASDRTPPAHIRIGMLAFPGMTYLDFAGPMDILTRPRGTEVLTLAKTRDPIRTDTGARILPDAALHDAPELDLLFVGGGPGVAELMDDLEVLTFFQERAPRAKWITSVCTGALVLGAAGLLRGYKATTHWTAMDILPVLGAQPVRERVVIDRNVITGGGVTAGIDMGLTVAARCGALRPLKLLQLASEYDPKPPFDSGSPDAAPSAIVERYRQISDRQTRERRSAAARRAALFTSSDAPSK